MADEEFLAALKAFEGREIGGLVGPDPVNQAMIRHWAQAMGDANPVYVDPEAAAESVHGEVIAPAVMLQAWTMQGLQPGGGRSSESGNEQDNLLNLVESRGFTSVVATNCEQEYDRMLHLGDHLMTRSVIESVSEEKQTALGVGHFITTRIEYVTLDGEPVGRQLFRILKFKPGTGHQAETARSASTTAAGADAAPQPKRPRPGITHDNGFFFEGAKAHRLLIQRCTKCQALRHPPQPRCDKCGSYEWDALESSGRGVVYSFVVNYYPQVPAFEYPLPIGLIELEEGTRLVAQIVDCPIGEITVGMPVEVTWIDADDELTVPAFRPAAIGANAASAS
jgi:3-oxo-4,17-pregnadiene-20-carboxyl-CoA hydratase alpha subunit